MGIFEPLSEAARRNPWIAIGIAFILFLFGGTMLVPLVSQFFMMGMGLELSEFTKMFGGDFSIHPNAYLVTVLIQAAHQIFAFFLPAWVLGQMLRYGDEKWGIQFGPFPQTWGLAIVIMMVCIPVVQVLNFNPEQTYLPESWAELEKSFRDMEQANQELLISILGTGDIGRLILNLIVFAMLPAICEELFFRGIIQQQFQRLVSPYLAILFASLLFSFIHFQFYGFFGRAALGMLLGIFFYRTRSIYPSMLSHLAFNGASILAVYLIQIRGGDIEANSLVEEIPPSFMIGGTVFLAALLWLFFRLTRLSNSTEAPADEE